MDAGNQEAVAAVALRGVIFDWAGTVIDFGSFAPMGVFVKAFARFGVEAAIAEARAPMGMAKAGKPTPAKAKAGAVMNPVMDKPMRRDILSVVTITPIHSETSMVTDNERLGPPT